jgi:hypothetical protein
MQLFFSKLADTDISYKTVKLNIETCLELFPGATLIGNEYDQFTVCMYVCMYACMYVCMYIYIYVCIYACMYVCMYVCMDR